MAASFLRGLAGAVAIHAGAATLLLLALPRPWLVDRVAQPRPVWIDVDPTPIEIVKAEPAPESTADHAQPAPLEVAGRSSVPRPIPSPAPASVDSAGPMLTDGTVGPDGINAATPVASARPSDGPTGGPGGNGPGGRARRPIDTGLGGGLHWAVVGPMPTSTTPRTLSTTGGLQEALDQHDRAIGLGFGGPATSAVRAAASNIAAPRVGLATIELVFDGLGKVRSARLLSANNDTAGWARVAADARAALAASSIRVPAQSGGLAVTLQVEARTQLPSGAKPGDAVDIHPSGLGAGAQFDLSDIGATPSRTVSVRIVGERRL